MVACMKRETRDYLMRGRSIEERFDVHAALRQPPNLEDILNPINWLAGTAGADIVKGSCKCITSAFLSTVTTTIPTDL